MANYITAIVIQKNTSVFIKEAGINAEKIPGSPGEYATGLGVSMEIPCPDNSSSGQIDGDFWAVPVNEGVVAGFNYVPYNPADTSAVAPTPESFAVVRISSNASSDVWYVLGTSVQYIASCNACCGTTPVPMPGIYSLPLQPGCQTMCQYNNGTDQQYFAVLGLPALINNQRYYPYGYFNGIALPLATSTGYVSTTTLLAFLNTATTTSVVNGVTTYSGGWAIVGTWTVSADHLSLIATQTDGPGTDVLCAAVAAINPSL
jgi:hypothetical protein